MRVLLPLALVAAVAWLAWRAPAPQERGTNRKEEPAAPADATEAVDDDAPDPPRTGVPARGLVFDEDGAPVAGAAVAVGDRRAVTDAAGRFESLALPMRSHTATVRARGFGTRTVRLDLSSTAEFRIRLRRGGAIAGVVRDEQGVALAGVRMRTETHATVSDGTGRYRLDDLPPGFLGEFVLERRGRAPRHDAGTVCIRAGETVAFDPVFRAGVAVAGATRPRTAVVLDRLEPFRDPVRVLSTTSDGHGAFRFDGVPHGRYLLHPYPRLPITRQHNTSRADRQILDVGDEDITGLRLAITADATTEAGVPPTPPFATVSGVVNGPDGRPAAGAPVRLLDEAHAWMRAPLRMVHADRHGRFEFAVEPDDRHRSLCVFAWHPVHAYAARPALRLRAGEHVEFELRLRKGHTVEGVVVDAAGAPQAGVFVSIDDPRPADVASHVAADRMLVRRTTNTDPAGRFRFDACPAASCRVSTYAAGRIGETDARPGGPPVRIQIDAHAGGRLGGIVVDVQGRPVHYAGVSVGDRSDSTDPFGRFFFDGVGDGPHVVNVFTLRSRVRFPDVRRDGVATDTLDLRITVGSASRVRGRVRAPDGTPIPFAELYVLPVAAPYVPPYHTDSAGRFELPGFDGSPEVAVFARGYLPRIVPAGADIRLDHGLSVAGRLLDAEGNPPRSGFRFRLVEPADPADLEPWQRKKQSYLPYFHAAADANGRFRVTGLIPGTYRVHEPLTLPATTFRAGAEDLVLRHVGTRTLTGWVADEAGRPVFMDGDLRLHVRATFDKRDVGYVPIDDDGRFRLDDVPDGELVLVVRAYPRSARAEVPPAVTEVRLQLRDR